MEARAIEAIRRKVEEAIRLFKESVRLNGSLKIALKAECLKNIDEILAKVDEKPINSKIKERIKVFLGEARRGITADPLVPTLAHLESLLRRL